MIVQLSLQQRYPQGALHRENTYGDIILDLGIPPPWSCSTQTAYRGAHGPPYPILPCVLTTLPLCLLLWWHHSHNFPLGMSPPWIHHILVAAYFLVAPWSLWSPSTPWWCLPLAMTNWSCLPNGHTMVAT